MANDGWPIAKLADIVDAVTVGHVGPMTSEYRDDGIPFLRSQNVKPFVIDQTDLKFINIEFHSKLAKSALSPGDVVIVRTGTPGTAAVIPDWLPEANCADLVIVRPSSKVLPRYIAYYINGVAMHHINSHVVGAVQQHFNVGSAKELPISLPSLDEQTAIVRALGQLDDKIELNRRMNETLGATARAIFRSWFVDFDPVVAKVDGRQPYGMSAETAALFPEHFEESELNPIPLGWSCGTIADIAQYVNGRNFTKNATGTGRMVIRIAELNSGPGGSTIYNDVEADSVSTAYPDDILFAWSGSLDVYRWHRDEALINQHIFKVVCDEYPKWFVHIQLQEAMPFFQGIAADKATTMGHIKRHHLSEADLTIPPQPLMDHATTVIQPFFDHIHTNERESMTIAAIRDTLLPKLLSGKIRLRDAKLVIEGVA